MDDKLDKAIENTVLMIRPNCKPEEALKFSQAALNLAQVRAIIFKGSATRKVAGASTPANQA